MMQRRRPEAGQPFVVRDDATAAQAQSNATQPLLPESRGKLEKLFEIGQAIF
jgi:hypothetical protein